MSDIDILSLKNKRDVSPFLNQVSRTTRAQDSPPKIPTGQSFKLIGRYQPTNQGLFAKVGANSGPMANGNGSRLCF